MENITAINTFKQIIESEEAIQKCLALYKKHGENCTISTTKVPFITIGTIGNYEVQVRYYRMFNQQPSWAFCLKSIGSMHSEGKYITCEEAVKAAIKTAGQKEYKKGNLLVYNSSLIPFNFNPKMQPLFDAMVEGKTIKSIKCISGNINKEDPTKDFTIEKFVALEYTIGFSSGPDGYHDYVETDKRSFYMNWVRSFELI